MKNQKIREVAKRKGVHMWELAEGLGIHESTFFRKMRSEFPADKQAQLLALIDRIAAEKTANQEEG